MIRFEKPKEYELCGICLDQCNTKVVFEDSEGNSSTQKLCSTCEYELYKKLHERRLTSK